MGGPYDTKVVYSLSNDTFAWKFLYLVQQFHIMKWSIKMLKGQALGANKKDWKVKLWVPIKKGWKVKLWVPIDKEIS